MNSETYCFENANHDRHLVFIAETNTAEEYATLKCRMYAALTANGYILKYPLMRRIEHAAYYKDELLPHTLTYIFLKRFENLLLTPLQLNVVLMYREKFSFEEVKSALNLKSDWLKKLNKQIMLKTSESDMKNFFVM
jgi:hypothetical protein